MTSKHPKIIKEIEAFLATRSKSDGGWPKVEQGDISKLHEIVALLIEAKYEADADNDLPILVEVTDRTRYHRSFFSPIPHIRPEDDGDLKKMMQLLRITAGNLSTAQEEHNRAMTRMRFIEEDLEKGQVIRFGKTAYESYAKGRDVSSIVASVKEEVLSLLVTMGKETLEKRCKDYSDAMKLAEELSKVLSEKTKLSIGVEALTWKSLKINVYIRSLHNVAPLRFKLEEIPFETA